MLILKKTGVMEMMAEEVEEICTRKQKNKKEMNKDTLVCKYTLMH